MWRLIVFVALRQLWDRKLLNGIAIIGVAMGVLTLIGVRGILEGFQRKFLDNIIRISPHVSLYDKQLSLKEPLLHRHIGEPTVAKVHHESPSDRALRLERPEELLASLKQIPGVISASPSLTGAAALSYGTQIYPVDLRGIRPETQDRVTPIAPYVIAGSFRALSSAPDAIILGSGVSTRLGAKVGDTVSATTAAGIQQSFRVVGLFEAAIPPVDNIRAYVSLRNAQSLLGKPETVGRIDVRLEDHEAAIEMAKRLERVYGYDAESWQEANANFLGVFKMQGQITEFIIAAILAVGGFGILAIQIMIVLQKTKDIAILRSVGFHKGDILWIFLLQGTVIAMLGAAVGDVAGHYLLRLLSTIKTKQEALVKTEFFLVYDDPIYYYYGFAFALIIGLIASAIPAFRASKVEPVDVLRGQI